MACKKTFCIACGAIVAAPTAADPSAIARRDRSGGVRGNHLDSTRTLLTGLIGLAVASASGIFGYFSWHAFRRDFPPTRADVKKAPSKLPKGGARLAETSPTLPPAAPSAAWGRVVTAKPPDPIVARPPGADEIAARCQASVGVVRAGDRQGTGFVIGRGLVATNARLIRRVPASSIRVSFPAAQPGQKGPHTAQVLHFDDDRDLAILAVSIAIAPLPIAEDHALRPEEGVILLDGPGLGGGRKLERIATQGVLRAEVRIDDLDYYQVSGSLGPAHSGSPVLDLTGRVVALVSARAARNGGTGLCVPVAALVDAIRATSARDPASFADAKERHEGALRLAAVAQPRPGGEKYVSDFLRKTEPATWLASVDAHQLLRNSDAQVAPFRQPLKRANAVYIEDDRTIAALLMRFVGKLKDAGLPISCGKLLDSSLAPTRDTPPQGGEQRSFVDFGEAYVRHRLDGQLDHQEARLRTEDEIRAEPVVQNLPSIAGPKPPLDLFPAAKALEDRGAKDLAIAAYQRLIDEFPGSMQAGIAKNRLKVLRPDPVKEKPRLDPKRIVPRG